MRVNLLWPPGEVLADRVELRRRGARLRTTVNSVGRRAKYLAMLWNDSISRAQKGSPSLVSVRVESLRNAEAHIIELWRTRKHNFVSLRSCRSKACAG